MQSMSSDSNNGCHWVLTHMRSCRFVAASDLNKYAWTPALQDNVEIWLNILKAAYPWTEILWASEWINIKHKLMSLIALAFSVIWDQVDAKCPPRDLVLHVVPACGKPIS